MFQSKNFLIDGTVRYQWNGRQHCKLNRKRFLFNLQCGLPSIDVCVDTDGKDNTVVNQLALVVHKDKPLYDPKDVVRML